MHPGYQAANHEYLLISDSGIRSTLVFLKKIIYHICHTLYFSVKKDTLTDMVSHMTESVGLVHQLPFSCDRAGLSATLEKVHTT